ncbi:MAG TPA: hypothetical protein VF153_00530, partial [Candidatus Limnocylindria bacterium]
SMGMPSPTLAAEQPPAPPPAERAAISVEPEPAAPAPIPMGPVVEPIEPAAAEAAQPVPEPVGVAAPTLPHESTEDEDADPSEVRRQIAAARRNMDPDHQIRRAMDAFLSPTRPNDPPN